MLVFLIGTKYSNHIKNDQEHLLISYPSTKSKNWYCKFVDGLLNSLLILLEFKMDQSTHFWNHDNIAKNSTNNNRIHLILRSVTSGYSLNSKPNRMAFPEDEYENVVKTKKSVCIACDRHYFVGNSVIDRFCRITAQFLWQVYVKKNFPYKFVHNIGKSHAIAVLSGCQIENLN